MPSNSVCGLPHSEDHRCSFRRARLARELPCIAYVSAVTDHRAFRDAGRCLGDLHVGQEDVDPYPATVDTGGKPPMDAPEATYRVTKMRHPGSGRQSDRSTKAEDTHITVRDVPDVARDFVVNGKAALTWVMEQRITTDKARGTVSDTNWYAVETAGDLRYPLDPLLRVITVRPETMKVVRDIPELRSE